ncbi:MAG: GNAT family N-acetyltransferase [Solirubrobacterales bacterium]
MSRELPDGYELDDDRGRVDLGVVHHFLSEQSYWAKGRSYAEVERLVEEATRVIGVYAADGSQVGFCRVVSDDAAFAFLGDVFVLEGHRGKGLGRALVAEAVERGPQSRLRWILGTEDAQELYAGYGFGRPSELVLERPPAEE